MRKALCVGIDSYQNINDLHGCVNDANSVKSALERNGDGTLNFEVKLMTSTSESTYITRANLKESTTPVQALKHCARLLRRRSQHLPFALAPAGAKAGYESLFVSILHIIE